MGHYIILSITGKYQHNPPRNRHCECAVLMAYVHCTHYLPLDVASQHGINGSSSHTQPISVCMDIKPTNGVDEHITTYLGHCFGKAITMDQSLLHADSRQGAFCASMNAKKQITSLTVSSSGNSTCEDRSLSATASACAGLSRMCGPHMYQRYQMGLT